MSLYERNTHMRTFASPDAQGIQIKIENGITDFLSIHDRRLPKADSPIMFRVRIAGLFTLVSLCVCNRTLLGLDLLNATL
jgi:hypothetical protein